MNPSASMIKAMIIHSKLPAEGITNVNVNSVINTYYFQIINEYNRDMIKNVLYFPGKSDFELFLYNGQIDTQILSYNIQLNITNISY